MKFHVSSWGSSQAAGATNADNAFITDTVLLARNNHLITTDPLQMRQAFALGASITDARFDSPSLASPSRMHVAPAQRTATVASRPFGLNLLSRPLTIPQNEEIATQLSNNLGAASENEFVVAVITPPNWTPQTLPGKPLNPMGPSEILMKATATVTVSNLAWGGGAALTFAENLKGGWYAIRAAQCQATSAIAFRFIFPRQMQGAKRPWRPGTLASNALGDTPEENMWYNSLGDWGYFGAFEPPLVEVLSVTGGSTAATLFIALTYLGDNPPPGIM